MANNRFVLTACAAILVEAYKKAITEYQAIMPLALGIEHDAPETYAALCANCEAGKLVVTKAFSAFAIYGEAGNVTFRVFHDYGHLLYGKNFTTKQEVELAYLQWQDVKKHIPQEWVAVAHTVYFADTVEQSLFEQETGAFPVDQKAFVQRRLDHSLNRQFVA